MNKNNTLCILDIETTGFEPEESEIVEIYILKVQNNKVIDEFYSLFKPEKNIKNSDIHGITDHKVRNAPRINEMSDEIQNYVPSCSVPMCFPDFLTPYASGWPRRRLGIGTGQWSFETGGYEYRQ